MTLVAPLRYALPVECPVKWTTVQERSISEDFPIPVDASETPQTYVRATYLRFLWLPESLLSLRYLNASLLRVSANPPSFGTHLLQELLRSLLLTPRTAAQKYNSRISQALEDDESPCDLEGNLMWFVYNSEKIEEPEQVAEDESHFETEERLKNAWLERMERREVKIQILLHFLFLSLPGAPQAASTTPTVIKLPEHLSPSKKRKRKERERTPALPVLSMEDCLESFMDKLSMWQLMASLDTENQPERGAQTSGKGKQKAEDARDWIQVFCEDIVEPQFKDKLPELCALLRSKVFASSPFDDDDSDSMASLSPPTSPRQKSKRLKPSKASSSRLSPLPLEGDGHKSSGSKAKQTKELQRARSRTLSVSLEEERARSRSASIEPGNLQKRLLTREVSMTTAFKGKIKAKEQEQQRAAARAKAAREIAKKSSSVSEPVVKARDSAKGVTLVAATPVKPRHQKDPSSQSTVSQTAPLQSNGDVPRLPMCNLEGIVEGDSDDGNWTLPSSPDILLLGSSSYGVDTTDSEDDGDHSGPLGKRNMLGDPCAGIAGTPTKTRAKRAKLTANP